MVIALILTGGLRSSSAVEFCGKKLIPQELNATSQTAGFNPDKSHCQKFLEIFCLAFSISLP